MENWFFESTYGLDSTEAETEAWNVIARMNTLARIVSTDAVGILRIFQ